MTRKIDVTDEIGGKVVGYVFIDDKDAEESIQGGKPLQAEIVITDKLYAKKLKEIITFNLAYSCESKISEQTKGGENKVPDENENVESKPAEEETKEEETPTEKSEEEEEEGEQSQPA